MVKNSQDIDTYKAFEVYAFEIRVISLRGEWVKIVIECIY